MKDKTVAVYLRVSTDEQSTDSQRHEISRYLEAGNMNENVQIYEDKGFTGTNTDRIDLKRLLSDCRQRKVDIVVCYKLDRLCRSLKDLIGILNELKELDVAFISIKDQIDMTTSHGRLMMQILGAFAEFEASIIKERVKAGISAARQKGIRIGRKTCGKDKEIAQLRSEGQTIRQISKALGISICAVQTAIARTGVLKPLEKTVVRNEEE
jgi:DNA invertase Pin-like site-specific DNA recombinase